MAELRTDKAESDHKSTRGGTKVEERFGIGGNFKGFNRKWRRDSVGLSFEHEK